VNHRNASTASAFFNILLGLATIAPDVTPKLARRTIAAIHVLGALHASPAVKAALSDRMK
jgi:hypothetical protein